MTVKLITVAAVCLVARLCLTLCDPLECCPPGAPSMGFFRQEYWSGLPCSPPGDLPDPGIEPASLRTPALAGRFFTTSATWEAHNLTCKYIICSFMGSAARFPFFCSGHTATHEAIQFIIKKKKSDRSWSSSIILSLEVWSELGWRLLEEKPSLDLCNVMYGTVMTPHVQINWHELPAVLSK